MSNREEKMQRTMHSRRRSFLMGVFAKYKSCFVDPSNDNATAPNPSNFEIIETWQIGKMLVAKIKYPDCTNFEGLKMCVFENTTSAQLAERVFIDPHFSGHDTSPVARFEPNMKGLRMAMMSAYGLEMERELWGGISG